MAELIIQVAIAGRHHSVLEKVEHFPYRIGRSFDNDLIIDDDTVSAHHLEILQGEEGELLLRNLSNENGSYLDGRKMSEMALPLLMPNKASLGRTTLTLLAADSPVAPTRIHVPGSWLTRWCSDARIMVLILACYLWVLSNAAVESYALWQNWDFVVGQYTNWLYWPLAMALVAGFISRMLLHNWRIFLQLSIAFTTFFSLRLLDDATGFLSYWLTSDGAAKLFSVLGMTGLLIALLSWQLRALSAASRGRASLAAMAVVLPLMMVVEGGALWKGDNFTNAAPMHTLLRPNDNRLQSTVGDIDEFREQVQEDLQSLLEAELRR